MALETLKGVEEIGGFKILFMEKVKEMHPELFSETAKWIGKDLIKRLNRIIL